jgi:probable phosphoglycerate mutase
VTLCLLARHAAHDFLDRVLVGRKDGVHLSHAGCREASALPERLRRFDISAVQSSPRHRSIETATPIARARGLPLETSPALDEIDFGSWTGCAFEELARDPEWRRWNDARSWSRPPDGESMREAQERIASHLIAMHKAYPGRCIVLVTHAEIIRAAILKAMSLPLDDWWRIEVPPASVTPLQLCSRAHSMLSLGEGMAVA